MITGWEKRGPGFLGLNETGKSLLWVWLWSLWWLSTLYLGNYLPSRPPGQEHLLVRSPLLQRIVLGWLCVCKTFHEEHERSFTHQGLSLADKISADWVNRKAVQEQKATQPFLESHGFYSPGSLYFKLVCYLAKTQYVNHLQLFPDKKSCEQADFLPTQPLKTKLKI